MKSLIVLAFGLMLVALAPRPAWALGESEDQLFKTEVTVAVARAKDFYAQKQREAAEDIERQKGAKAAEAQQAKFAAEQEKKREEFVEARNARPSEWLEQARLERAFDEKKLLEDKQMDRNRREYKKKRQRVEHIIQTEAHIDENEEYGL